MNGFARRFNVLIWMTRCDFKLRDQGTFLGFIWTLLNPLAMFTVLYLVFKNWYGPLIEHYAVYLALGIIHWNFFSLATSSAVSILERKRHYLKAFAIDALTLPMSAVLTVFASYCVEAFAVVALSSMVVGITASGLAWFTLLLLIHLVLVLGVSFLLANAFIFFRDVLHLWGILLRVGFFVTPVFYPLTIVEPKALFILKLNPLYYLFSFSRQAVFDGSIQVDGHFVFLLSISLGTLLVATMLYHSNRYKLIEML